MHRKTEVIAAIIVIAGIILIGVGWCSSAAQRPATPNPTHLYTTTTQPAPIEQTIEVTLPDTGGSRI